MLHWCFTHFWIFIIGLLYMAWTVHSFSDGFKTFKIIGREAKRKDISCWKYIRTYGFLYCTDDDVIGTSFLIWLVINGTLLSVASFVAFHADSCA